MTNKKLIGVRDPLGIRPLVLGKLKGSYILASETCALDIIGAKFIREIENGEIIIIEKESFKSLNPFPKKKADRVFLNIFIFQDQIVFLKTNVLMSIEKILVMSLQKRVII